MGEPTGTIGDFMVGGSHDDGSHICASGQKAEHERGVLYQGAWEVYADGFCEHVRRCARALSMAGLPVHLRSVLPRHRTPLGEDRLVDKLYEDLLHASISTYVVQVQQVVPTPNLLARLVTHRHYTPKQISSINSRRVLSTVWERLHGVAPDDLAAFSVCGQAWVGAPAHRDMLIAGGVPAEKVRVVPCPYLPDDPHLHLADRERRPGPVRFYHIGKWEPRKEQRNIFMVFMRAFRPGEAMLMLKTSPSSPPIDNYPRSPQEAIAECLKDELVKANGWDEKSLSRGVFVFAKRLTGEQMINLHRMGDVYVSLSRGEGFDMPALDAKLSGNLLLYTPSGGTQEFAGENDVEVAQAGLIPCHPFYGWPKGALYIDYSVDDAVEAMRKAAALASERKFSVSEIDRLAPRFSAAAVGKMMRSNLEELVEGEIV